MFSLAGMFRVSAKHNPTAIDSSQLNYRVLDDLTEVEAIAQEWDALLDRSPCNRAFSSAAWYLAACRYNPTLTPNVVVARRNSTLVAVLPLALMDDGQTVAFPIRFSDYNDIVAASDDLDAAVSVLSHVISASNGYRRISLSNLRSDSNCLRAAKLILSASEFDRMFQVTIMCPYILLPSSYDQYLASRSAKLRKNLRRALRDARESNLSVQELDPASFPAEELPEVFLSLQFNRKGANSCFEPPSLQSFVREALRRLFTERKLRVFALFEEQKIIGVDLYMVGANSICSWNGGFLEEAARWSPVKLLNDAAIKLAFDLQLEEYDYLRGEQRYKLSWTNASRPVGRLEIDVKDHRLAH